MVVTCPYCRHSVEESAGTLKCDNCGSRLPGRSIPAISRPPQATPPIAVPAGVADGLPLSPPSDRVAIASLVCGLLFFIPLVTQLAAVVLGIVALARRAPHRRPALAAIGLLLGLLVGGGWSWIVASSITGGAGAAMWATYGGAYSSGGQDGESEDLAILLERLGRAAAAYQRDMRRWPASPRVLAPTYLSPSVAQQVDPESASGDRRLVTWVTDVNPTEDDPERIVAYSVPVEYDEFGQKLPAPACWVLRLNEEVLRLPPEEVKADLARYVSLPEEPDQDQQAGDHPAPTETNPSARGD